MGVEEREFTTSLWKTKEQLAFPPFTQLIADTASWAYTQGDTSALKRNSAKEQKDAPNPQETEGPREWRGLGGGG